MTTKGIHHITAIASHLQNNYDFYAGLLGLRLVKKTINFDDPQTCHLYYGDSMGNPGTLLTFFLWPQGKAGRGGVHQANTVSLAIPTSSLGYWINRLIENRVAFSGPLERFTHKILRFKDPDGMAIELVTTDDPSAAQPWPNATVPVEAAIRGIYSIQLWVLESQATINLLQKLGYNIQGTQDNITYMTPEEGMGNIEIRATGQFLAAQEGTGTIHHLALYVPDDATQQQISNDLRQQGFPVTRVKDRHYFRSVYFPEPGGVLLEIATDKPGFTLDEDAASLGESLKLPPYLEFQRVYIESTLPQVHTKGIYEHS